MASSNQQNWNPLHEEIKVHLQKEVHLMRELLSNLHQEVLDKEQSIQILEQRQSLLKRLNQSKEQKLSAIQKLEVLIDPNNKDLKLEQILPLGNEQTAEILSLNDQLGALTKKMNQHNIDSRNAIKQGRRLVRTKPLKKKTATLIQEKNT